MSDDIMQRPRVGQDYGAGLLVDRFTRRIQSADTLLGILDRKQRPVAVAGGPRQDRFERRVQAHDDAFALEELEHVRLYDQAAATGHDGAVSRVPAFDEFP